MAKGKKDRFDGLTFVGIYTKTTIVLPKPGPVSSNGKAKITIKLVGPGAYLVTVVEEDNTTFNNLAYLQQGALYSATQSGNGETSTYFEGKKLVHQVSDKSPKVWLVANYLCKRVKKDKRDC